jgi:hypothetical protein
MGLPAHVAVPQAQSRTDRDDSEESPSRPLQWSRPSDVRLPNGWAISCGAKRRQLHRLVMQLPVEIIQHLPKFEDRQWALRPVVFPAYDEIAADRIVTMVPERPTPMLKLDSHSLPTLLLGIDATFRFAVRKRRMNGLNDKPELIRNHAEQKHDTLLVHWGVPQTTEIDWRAVDWSVDLVPRGRLRSITGLGHDRRRRNLVTRLRVELFQKRRCGLFPLKPVAVCDQRTLKSAEAASDNVGGDVGSVREDRPRRNLA